MDKKKIQKFTDLEVWKESHKLVLMIYAVTKNFPKDEMFGLTSQMRRAAVSITSNTAEGFSRHSSKEKLHFYSMAHGSLTELQNQLLISKDVNYIENVDFVSSRLTKLSGLIPDHMENMVLKLRYN